MYILVLPKSDANKRKRIIFRKIDEILAQTYKESLSTLPVYSSIKRISKYVDGTFRKHFRHEEKGSISRSRESDRINTRYSHFYFNKRKSPGSHTSLHYHRK